MTAALDQAIKQWGTEARVAWDPDVRENIDRHQEHMDGLLDQWEIGLSTAEAKAFLLGASSAMRTVARVFACSDIEFWHALPDEAAEGTKYDRETMVEDITDTTEFQGAMALAIADAAARYEAALALAGVGEYLFDLTEEDRGTMNDDGHTYD